MPFEWLATMCAAMNQVRSGRWLPCITVPAVTEVCRRHPAHSHAGRSWFNAQPLRALQTGQTNPSGHRRSTRYRAQAASSGKRASNSWRDIGRSDFQRAGMTEQYRNARSVTSTSHHILEPRTQGDKPSPSICRKNNVRARRLIQRPANWFRPDAIAIVKEVKIYPMIRSQN